MKTNIISIEQLLAKPVCMMTGEEMISLLSSNTDSGTARVSAEEAPESKHYEFGIAGIAKIFGCSIPTANRIKASGKIDKAISQIGRKIIIDTDLALQLAKEK